MAVNTTDNEIPHIPDLLLSEKDGNETVVPTPAPSSGGNNTNHTTPAPTHAPTPASNSTPTPEPTPAPTTPAPTTPAPAPTTRSPTMAPSAADDPQEEGISFFRMIGKMLAWCILMGLGVLLYGFCIQHKYQIAYYLRHLGHLLKACNAWLIQKVRPDPHNHTLHRGYAAMYASERNDALAQSLFDSPHDTGGMSMMFEDTNAAAANNNLPNYNTDRGFLMGGAGQQSQHMNFPSMNNQWGG